MKPYHGIQWLENTGGYPFADHTLAQMPGVLPRASRIGRRWRSRHRGLRPPGRRLRLDEKVLPALVWLEQTRPGTFVRHTIDMGLPRHATLDIGDVDGDGAPDIVVGNFSIDQPIASWVDVWMNKRKEKLAPTVDGLVAGST